MQGVSLFLLEKVVRIKFTYFISFEDYFVVTMYYNKVSGLMYK